MAYSSTALSLVLGQWVAHTPKSIKVSDDILYNKAMAPTPHLWLETPLIRDNMNVQT